MGHGAFPSYSLICAETPFLISEIARSSGLPLSRSNENWRSRRCKERDRLGYEAEDGPQSFGSEALDLGRVCHPGRLARVDDVEQVSCSRPVLVEASLSVACPEELVECSSLSGIQRFVTMAELPKSSVEGEEVSHVSPLRLGEKPEGVPPDRHAIRIEEDHGPLQALAPMLDPSSFGEDASELPVRVTWNAPDVPRRAIQPYALKGGQAALVLLDEDEMPERRIDRDGASRGSLEPHPLRRSAIRREEAVGR